MSLGPVMLKPRTVPMLSGLLGLLAAIFVILALFLDGTVRSIALVIAAGFLLWAAWVLVQARRSAVLIDTHQFIVKTGGRQTRFEISQIESVDLSRLRSQVRFKDGSSVTLPLEGDDLMEAGLLLNPTADEG